MEIVLAGVSDYACGAGETDGISCRRLSVDAVLYAAWSTGCASRTGPCGRRVIGCRLAGNGQRNYENETSHQTGLRGIAKILHNLLEPNVHAKVVVVAPDW